MDYDTIFSEKESQALLNKCQLKYDPGHFSFKPRLFFTKYRKELQPVNVNYSSEIDLLSVISRNIEGTVKMSDISFKGAVCGTDDLIEVDYNSDLDGSLRLSLIHRNNYYIDLHKLSKDLTMSLTDLVNLKKTRIYEAIVMLMIAITHYNSLVPHLKWLCNSEYHNVSYYDMVELKPLADALKECETSGNLDKGMMFYEPSVCSVPSPVCHTSEVDAFKDASDSVFKQILWDTLIFGTELMCRIETIPDEDLKRIIYNMFHSDTPVNSIANLLYYENGLGNIVPTDEILEIAKIKDMEQRYYAIRDFADKNFSNFDTYLSEYKKDIGLTRIFNEFIKFCQNESVMNIRIKTIIMLYNFVKKKGWLTEVSSSGGGIPIPGLDIDVNDMEEGHSMIDFNYAQYDNVEMSNPVETDTPKTKLEHIDGNVFYEELDKLKTDFTNGGYDFNVKDVVSKSDHDRANYNKIAENMSLLNSNLIRSIKEIKVYNTGGKNPGKKAGKLDRKNIYKYKTSKDIFFDNTYKIKESDLAFGIVLDVSGSMSGDGITNGRATMIVLHETLKALNINHSIITHTSRRHHNCIIERFQSFKEDKTYDCTKNYALANIRSHGGNCDSGALYYMEKALLRTKNKDKICIIFSDGEPTECSDAELKDQVRHMEKKGIKVIGVGIDFPHIKEYYRNNANGKNLKEMFDIVSNILKEYILEKVDKE